MSTDRPLTLLCVATYFKGTTFLEACKARGCRVLLLTVEKLQHEAWPHESIDELFFAPMQGTEVDMASLVKGVSHIARTRRIDRIVALDDFDLEKAAALREHLRVPGMGDTRTRYFRDKLAMRTQALEAGIPVPEFVHVLNEEEVHAFMARVPGPWVVKPRSQASATGIKKVRDAADFERVYHALGDEHASYLMERFVPGDVYHVDSIIYDEEVVFARVHRYGETPMKVAHEGGIFVTHTVPYAGPEDVALQALNRDVMRAMGLRRGVSHTEFIRAHADGQYYFLETSARVGGANIAETLEASSGINLWREWAHIETLRPGEAYTLPPVRNDHSGILISLARQEYPDLSGYTDLEIVWRMHKRHHAGLIVRSPDLGRVTALLAQYAERFYQDFFATAPLPERPVA